jgi:hypothetical protein
VTEFEIRNKIHEVRSYIASDWPGIEERKHLYQQLARLEQKLKEIQNAEKK